MKSFLDPSSAKNMTHEDILMFESDSSTRDLLLGINPPQDFRHMVQISEHCYVVFTVPSTVNPTGYCHFQRQQNGHWLCPNNTCNRKTNNSKQIKSKQTCFYLHVLFRIPKLSLPDIPEAVHVPSTSSGNIASTVQSSGLSQDHSSTNSGSTSVGRMSTVKLNLKRSIPNPVLQELFGTHGKNGPDCFVPQSRSILHCNAFCIKKKNTECAIENRNPTRLLNKN